MIDEPIVLAECGQRKPRGSGAMIFWGPTGGVLGLLWTGRSRLHRCWIMVTNGCFESAWALHNAHQSSDEIADLKAQRLIEIFASNHLSVVIVWFNDWVKTHFLLGNAQSVPEISSLADVPKLFHRRSRLREAGSQWQDSALWWEVQEYCFYRNDIFGFSMCF